MAKNRFWPQKYRKMGVFKKGIFRPNTFILSSDSRFYWFLAIFFRYFCFKIRYFCLKIGRKTSQNVTFSNMEYLSLGSTSRPFLRIFWSKMTPKSGFWPYLSEIKSIWPETIFFELFSFFWPYSDKFFFDCLKKCKKYFFLEAYRKSIFRPKNDQKIDFEPKNVKKIINSNMEYLSLGRPGTCFFRDFLPFFRFFFDIFGVKIDFWSFLGRKIDFL